MWRGMTSGFTGRWFYLFVGQNDFGQLSLLWISAGCCTLGWEQIVAPGEMDLRGPVSTSLLSGSHPQTPTAVGHCWMLAGQKKHREKMKMNVSRQKICNVGDIYSPYCLPFPKAPLCLQAFLWRLLFCPGTGKPPLMAASAEVGGSSGKQCAPKSRAGTLQWWRAPRQGDGCPHSEHLREVNLPRQRCLGPHHIPTVPGKYNKARGSQLCMHTAMFLLYICCYGSHPTSWVITEKFSGLKYSCETSCNQNMWFAVPY